MITIIKIILVLLAIFIGFILYNTYDRATSPYFVTDESFSKNAKYEKVIFAGGCFWCTESEFEHVIGVVSAVSGYADTNKANPSYQEVSDGSVTAREAVEVIYDPKIVSFYKLLQIYFKHINPVDSDGQFGDRGHQYSPAIYFLNDDQHRKAIDLIEKIDLSKKFKEKVKVEVLPFNNFYGAEEYHQNYKNKNPVRYNLYREASGRNKFIRDYWGEDSSFVSEIFDSENMKTQKKDWKNFNKDDKVKALKELNSLQYKVTQEEGTETPYTNDFYSPEDKGVYVDVVSGEPLFLSIDKYDSGTGWPSFVKPINLSNVKFLVEDGIFSSRTEVRSKIADSHLGHVFDDGPKNRGGKRYCMNGSALRFIPFKDMEEKGYSEIKELLN